MIGVFIFVMGFTSVDFWSVGSIWTRYLLGLPGGFLIGFGFFSYYRGEKDILKPLRVQRYFLFIGISFLIYGVLGGLVVPKGNFSPSNLLNTDSFLSTVKLPVQAFRAICAIIAAWAASRMLKIFHWGTTRKLQEAVILKQQLKESEERYMGIVENSSDMIYFIDTDSFIVFTNRQGHEALGRLKEDLIGRHIKEIFAPEMRDKVEEGFKTMKQEGALFIDSAKVIKKDGEKLDTEINSFGVYDSKGEFAGVRLIVRDIAEKVRLNNELKQRVEELEEFYDMAVDRELKIIELRDEMVRLKEELERCKYS